MTALRRLASFALGVAVLHLVFGAIVRISGSGMGCGEHWPTCFGHWFPPLDQPTVVIEWTHRLLAAIVSVLALSLAALSVTRRDEPGVGGPGGVLRAALLALALVVCTALFGALTVRLDNAPLATAGHWALAALVLAAFAAAVIRAGGLGGPVTQPASRKAVRGAVAGTALAFVTIVMGGLTAKIPGANTACPSFPLCGGGPLSTVPAQHVQMTHRVLAFLLFFHLLGLMIAFAKRREPAVLVRATRVAFALVAAQVVVAGAMIGLHLPAALRSLHQAIGVFIWLTLFTLTYLARRAAHVPALAHTMEVRAVMTRGAAP